MKDVIDLKGKVKSVAAETPTNVVDGKHYLLSPADKDEIARKETAFIAAAPERRTGRINAARRLAYGTAEEQLDFIAANGLDAWLAKRAAIDKANPL